MPTKYWFLAVALCIPLGIRAADAPVSARDLGVPFHGTPGAFNAITDVAGIEVGRAR